MLLLESLAIRAATVDDVQERNTPVQGLSLNLAQTP